MGKCAFRTTEISQSEIMVRNLQAAGFSDEEIHYEMSGYGSVQMVDRLLGSEQPDETRQRDL